jgi:hypothetical protein
MGGFEVPTPTTNRWGRDGRLFRTLRATALLAWLCVPAPAPAQAGGATTVIEFYNDALDHYFISPLADDIEALDSGRFPGWSRTGWQFDAFPVPEPGTSAVCRFYIPPEHGDSHFFSASPAECAAVRGKIATDPNYSGYLEETPNAFYIALPDLATGACPPAALGPALNPSSIFRLWNTRADSNHRYATSPEVRAQMIAQGYVSEGYGPQGVAMCSLNARAGDSRVRATARSALPAGCDGVAATGVRYSGSEVEPMIAANPTHPDNLIGVWQQDRWSDGGAAGLRTGFSFDGGRSWSLTQAPLSRCTGGNAANGSDYARATDPWVSFAPDGTAFQIGLAFTGATFGAGSSNAVLVSRSIDGGRIWSEATALIRDGAAAFNDKESITADRYRPGRVYATWDRIVPSGAGPTYFARSIDNGASWEAARPIFDPGPRSQTINNQIVALPGVIVDFFTQLDPGPGGSTIARLALIRSMDEGATWSQPIYIGPVQALGTRDPELGTALRDGAILGSFAGGTDGQLAAVWQDARFSAGERDGVAFARSTDGGLTWSPPLQVNSVPAVQALLPAVTLRDDGLHAVLYYDMRNNTSEASLLVDVWLATSADGVVWHETHVAGPFDYQHAPRASGGALFIGDYQAIAHAGAVLHPFYAQALSDPANRSDVYASVLRSIGDGAAGARKVYRAASAPALVPSGEVRGRLQAGIARVLDGRRVGPLDRAVSAAPAR